MFAFGMWWLNREEARARAIGEGFGEGSPASADQLAADEKLRERATMAREFDPAELTHGRSAATPPPLAAAALRLITETDSLPAPWPSSDSHPSYGENAWIEISLQRFPPASGSRLRRYRAPGALPNGSHICSSFHMAMLSAISPS